MSASASFRLSGMARAADVASMLDQMCEHFVEHAQVSRKGDVATMTSAAGTASLRAAQGGIVIELDCPSEQALQMSRISIAEHMFYFAGDTPFDLTWSGAPRAATVSNLHHVTVVSAEDVTPRMRRVIFACADVSPFIDGDMHVRLLVPPAGREPVWPGVRTDGRIAWPQGDDALVVRAYTIRAVDVERGELSIDFYQHPEPGLETPGADFARDAQPGMKVALMGPGSGHLPSARSIFLAGDESALPAIARIAAEVPEGTRLRALIEVADAAEEQPLPSSGMLQVAWRHRDGDASQAEAFGEEIKQAISTLEEGTFVWVACEKEDVRSVRSLLKRRGHPRKDMYVAWYWQRDAAGGTDD